MAAAFRLFGRTQVMAACNRGKAMTACNHDKRMGMQEAGKRSAFAGPLFMFAGGIHNCNGSKTRPILKKISLKARKYWHFCEENRKIYTDIFSKRHNLD